MLISQLFERVVEASCRRELCLAAVRTCFAIVEVSNTIRTKYGNLFLGLINEFSDCRLEN